MKCHQLILGSLTCSSSQLHHQPSDCLQHVCLSVLPNKPLDTNSVLQREKGVFSDVQAKTKKRLQAGLPVVAGVLLDPRIPNKKCQTFIIIDIRFITKPYRDCCIIQQSVFSWCQNRRGIPRGREGARKDWRQVNEKKSGFSLTLSQECWMGKRKRGDISRGT